MNQAGLEVSLLGGHPTSAPGQFCRFSSGVAPTSPGSVPFKLTSSGASLRSFLGVAKALAVGAPDAGAASTEDLCGEIQPLPVNRKNIKKAIGQIGLMVKKSPGKD